MYWLSWTMKSICDPLTPPAALISLTASFAPFAAGTSSADSSPVRAKPPPILMVPPAPVVGWPVAPPPPGLAVGELHAATRRIALASATVVRVIAPPPNHGARVSFPRARVLEREGGGPTDDKPTVTLTTPPDPNRTCAFLNIRVADISQVYREWSAKGAEFLTEPKDHGREIRAYVRDPDGHLIEVGQFVPNPA